MQHFESFVLLRNLIRSTIPLTRSASSLRTHTKEQFSLRKKLAKYERHSQANPLVDLNSVKISPTNCSQISDDIQMQSNNQSISVTEEVNLIESSASDFTKLQDLHKMYNQENPNLPRLSAHCVGCGSQLQCNSAGLPGFIPVPEYETITNQIHAKSSKTRTRRYARIPIQTICVRCRLLKDHKTASMSVLEPESYDTQVASVIRDHEDTSILVVADMVNMPHSLIPNLHTKLNGSRYVLIGNKVDQLPIDGPHYLDRWKRALVEDFKLRCKVPESLISHVSLVSALTGYGMSGLIDFLLSYRFQSKCPVYLVGSTNVGKSSVFNRLILSDFCKAEARERIHRATVSVWPGTTTGLLSFPMTLLTNPAKYAKRTVALQIQKEQQMFKPSVEVVKSYGFKYLKPHEVPIGLQDTQSPFSRAIEQVRNTLPDLTKLPTYSWESQTQSGSSKPSNEQTAGRVSCLANEYDMEQLYEDYLPGETQIDQMSWDGDQGDRLLSNLLDPRQFNPHAWCHDTPGFVCQDQILNYLAPNDYLWLNRFQSHGSGQPMITSDKRIKLSKVIVPRTFILRSGLSLLLGRLGRLDVIQASYPVYLTTFSNLPIHIVDRTEVDDYVIKYARFLGPGFDHESSDAQRGLAGCLMPLESVSLEPLAISGVADTPMVDVILSGAGWVSVTCSQASNLSNDSAEPLTCQTIENNDSSESDPSSSSLDQTIRLDAWTPGGLGISLRKPCLIPGAFKRRGPRLPKTREFSRLG